MALLPPLADEGDLADLLGGVVDSSRAAAALNAASALVRGFTSQTWLAFGESLDDVPDGVQQATLNIARRVYTAPDDNVTSETAGPYTVTRSGGLWLSSTDRMLLSPYRVGGGHASVSPDSLSTLYWWDNALVPIAGQPDADYVELTPGELA